jgi:hypothetical protein
MRSAVSFVLVLVGALCTLADDTPAHSAAATSVAYTPQEKYLAQTPYGNFACKVNSIKVTTENPGPEGTVPLVDVDAIRAAFQQVATLEWAHIAQTSFSSLDGRNDEKVLSTPGGDMGEFIQALAVFGKLRNKKLTQEEVQHIFEKYIKTMTRSKFFYETDEKAYMRLAVATGCRNLRVAEMGPMRHKREAFLEKVALPDHIGDPFIKFLAKNATELDLDADYIHAALAAYHNVLWTSPSKLSTKLCYMETKGPSQQEAAIVFIKTESYCVDQGLAPMISQQLACAAPVYVSHTEAVRVFRRELVSILAEGANDVKPSDVMAALNQFAEANQSKFLAEVAPNVPVYTVEFLNSSPLLATEVDFVPQP